MPDPIRWPSFKPMTDTRYARQMILGQIGRRGQTKFAAARAIIVGCGALGSYQAQLLGRAGVGNLRIIDRDFVERSNLQRQILFTDADADEARPKAIAAERAIREINPEISVEGVVDDLNASTADELLAGADVICDGTDNFEARYLVNDFAVLHETPWVYAGVIGTDGLVLPIVPKQTPCLRCVFETPPPPGSLPTCESAGVLGSAVAVIAGLQVTEVLKLLVGDLDAVTRALIRYDAWKAEFSMVDVGSPRADCPVCGGLDFAYLDGRLGSRAAKLCGRNAIQLMPRDAEAPPSLDRIAKSLSSGWQVTSYGEVLRATKNGITVNVFQDGRAIIDGTTDETRARSLYAQVVGT